MLLIPLRFSFIISELESQNILILLFFDSPFPYFTSRGRHTPVYSCKPSYFWMLRFKCRTHELYHACFGLKQSVYFK